MPIVLMPVDGDMTRTITVLECDGCDEILLGCTDGHHNREMNTLAIARRFEWVRIRDGDDLKDYCPKCRVQHAK